MSTRTRKFGPERALLDPREQFLHKLFERSKPVAGAADVLSSLLQCGEVCSAERPSARRRAKFEGAEAHDLQPGEVFGVSAWAKARQPAGPQPGVVVMCSLVRVGVGEGLVGCSSESLSTSGGLGRYRAAQWHLARAVGKRFRGCRAKRLFVDE